MQNMRLFDANACLGRPPVRQPSAFTDAAGLAAAMSACGVSAALVYSPAAINADLVAANQRLLAETDVERGIHPAWVLLPPGTGEMDSPVTLVNEMMQRGVRAARLMPRAHGYAVRVRTLGPLLERLAEHQTDVFDGVVIIDVRVALRLHGEVKQPVFREQGQHVIEKRHAGVDLPHPAAVDGQGQGNVRFRRLAFDGCYALGVFSHASRVSLKTAISPSVPTLMRRNEAVKAWLGKCRTRTFRA